MMRPAGFTLIELAVVLAIMAIAAGAVTWTMADARQAATLDDAIGRVYFADQQARTVATRHNRGVILRFDLRNQTMQRIEPANPDGVPASLPAGFRITSIRTASDRVSDSTIDIPIASRGWSETYALELSAAGEQDAATTWLVIAGMTGQPTRIDDEQDLETILQQTRE